MSLQVLQIVNALQSVCFFDIDNIFLCEKQTSVSGGAGGGVKIFGRRVGGVQKKPKKSACLLWTGFFQMLKVDLSYFSLQPTMKTGEWLSFSSV